MMAWVGIVAVVLGVLFVFGAIGTLAVFVVLGERPSVMRWFLALGI